MAKTMTPSGTAGMTDGQIEKAVDHYRNALRKRREEIGGSEEVQSVLGSDGYIHDLVGVLLRWVAMMSSIICRTVHVDRNMTPQQIIDATGRHAWYIDEQVLAEMPLHGWDETTVKFFELDYDPTVDDLDREYKARGLRPDPAAVAQVMTDDPTFADERPVVCQWRDNKNRACYVGFDRNGGKRFVNVDRLGLRWRRQCRFGGVADS